MQSLQLFLCLHSCLCLCCHQQRLNKIYDYPTETSLGGVVRLSPEKEKGKLYITDLMNYVIDRVPRLVRKEGLGAQTPIVNVERFNDDFLVAKTPPN